MDYSGFMMDYFIMLLINDPAAAECQRISESCTDAPDTQGKGRGMLCREQNRIFNLTITGL